ncbi:peptidoglycan-binding protein [bacterium]|nr:peptidoglycan-binding protein [bacterium]
MGTGLLTVMALACLPALGNFGGGLLAEFLKPTKKMLNMALHAAAGILISVVAVEVMPEALKQASAWMLGLAIMAGGGTYILIDSGIERWQAGKASQTGGGVWMVYLAVASDLVGDGLLIGAGSAVSSQLAIMLAFGQVLADIPEGFAVIATFREKGFGRRKRILISASFAIPVIVSALFAFFVLRGMSDAVKMTGLVFVAGLYLLAAVEDMIGEAHGSAEDTKWSAASFLAGFALFLAISGSFGQ